MREDMMMKWNTLKYLFKEGIVGLWKNRVMALASAGTIILCLLILGMSYSLGTNIDYILKQIETKFGITSYIKEGTTENKILELRAKIAGLPHVQEVKYISKEAALNAFKEGMKDNAIFEDFTKDNPLPASFEIIVDSVEFQDLVVKELAKMTELDTRYLEKETDIFIKINDTINYISWSISGALIIVGLLLMSNTIKLTVYIRRKEINIMKYIGATDRFIRLPFLIEGMVIGTISALIAIIVIVVSYSWLSNVLITELIGLLNGVTFRPIGEIMHRLIPVCMIIGSGIGFIGSGMAIRKHLKV
jgi:cell division transport system permease protein